MTVCPHDSVHAATAPVTRSAAFASVAVVISLAGHAAGGGTTPAAPDVAVALALATVGHSALLARRECSATVLVLALGVAQAALHLVFNAAGGHGEMVVAGAAHSSADGPTGLTMLAGHAIAAILLGCFLREGERLLWAAARRAAIRAGVSIRPLGPAALRTLLDARPARLERVGWKGTAPERRRRVALSRHRAAGCQPWRAPPQEARTA